MVQEHKITFHYLGITLGRRKFLQGKFLEHSIMIRMLLKKW